MSNIFAWPESLIPADNSLTPISNSKSFTSPFSGSTQTVSFPGTKWQFDMTFQNLNETERRTLEVMLAKLDGQSGRVLLWDFAARLLSNPQPVYGVPVVSLASSMSSRIYSRGWTSNRRVLNFGDWIQIGYELKRVTEDVDSDIAGNAVIPIAPMLRNEYVSGTELIISCPKGLFMLADAKQGKVKRVPKFGSSSLTLIESFYP